MIAEARALCSPTASTFSATTIASTIDLTQNRSIAPQAHATHRPAVVTVSQISLTEHIEIDDADVTAGKDEL